jgi:hypothetical protein
MARETLTSLHDERDALMRRVDELFEENIRLQSAIAVAKRVLDRVGNA